MNKVNFIFDLDGTLLDSYEVIVSSLYELYLEQGIEIDKKDIFHDIIKDSVASFIEKMELEFGIDFSTLKNRYSEISSKKQDNIKLIKHAYELLEYLKDNNVDCFIFTHRGITTKKVMDNVGISTYFKEIVNSLNGFPRKPDPTGINYLVDKYHLDRNKTYYVGDRTLDIECAYNANIKSIMYLPLTNVAVPTKKETYIIKDLLEIKDIYLKEISAHQLIDVILIKLLF